jgi:hypothetical protein
VAKAKRPRATRVARRRTRSTRRTRPTRRRQLQPRVAAPPPFEDPKISHPRKRAFLAAFGRVGNVSRAAHLAGINRRTHTQWLKDDAAYGTAFEDAREHAADHLVEVATAYAHAGNAPLLQFLLKGLRPEVYRERYEHTGKDGGPLAFELVDQARDTLMRKLERLATRMQNTAAAPGAS